MKKGQDRPLWFVLPLFILCNILRRNGERSISLPKVPISQYPDGKKVYAPYNKRYGASGIPLSI